MPSRTSPKRKRTTKPPAEREAELLSAAHAVFAEKGRGATIDDVAERAAVAKGTVYLYFESKDHLLGAMWERYVHGFLDIAEAMLPDDRSTVEDWLGAIEDVVERLAVHALEHAELHRIVYASADAKALALCRDTNQRVITLLSAAIRRGVRDGALTPSDPDLAARLIYHGTDGVLHDVIVGTIRVSRRTLVRTYRDLVRRTLTDCPQPAKSPRQAPPDGAA